MALLAQSGLSAVTHRAVAERAGVPLAATTYYFASGDDLLEQALRRFVERDLAENRATPSDDLATELLSAVIGDDEASRRLSLTAYEIYVQAGRNSRLRAVAREWNEGVVQQVREILGRHGRDESRAWVIAALLDGIVLELLVTGDTTAVAHDQLASALKALT